MFCLLSDNIFFFFQAEDGIRDGHVTGVQTCALPILVEFAASLPARYKLRFSSGKYLLRKAMRSEERRVGKECRSRWALHDEKKKVQDIIEVNVVEPAAATRQVASGVDWVTQYICCAS